MIEEEDDLDQIVGDVEQKAVVERAETLEDRRPWFYMGWIICCQENGSPIAMRPEDIRIVRPDSSGVRCGLSLAGREKTVIVWGEFMDIIDMGAAES